MGLNKLDTVVYDDLPNQISIQVLSSNNELYALWKEKDEVIIQVHYCKQYNFLKMLEGSLGLTIKEANISEGQKISKCSDALEKVIMTQKSLANIKRQKELIDRNNELIGLNQQIIEKSNLT